MLKVRTDTSDWTTVKSFLYIYHPYCFIADILLCICCPISNNKFQYRNIRIYLRKCLWKQKIHVFITFLLRSMYLYNALMTKNFSWAILFIYFFLHLLRYLSMLEWSWSLLKILARSTWEILPWVSSILIFNMWNV